jgi:hypothetical protein
LRAKLQKEWTRRDLLMARFRSAGQISVCKGDFQWQVRHWGGASSAHANHRGLAVSDFAQPGRTKELRIEFDFTDYFFSAPAQQAEFEDRLRTVIEAAIEAGWRPFSRGKTFIFMCSRIS